MCLQDFFELKRQNHVGKPLSNLDKEVKWTILKVEEGDELLGFGMQEWKLDFRHS